MPDNSSLKQKHMRRLSASVMVVAMLLSSTPAIAQTGPEPAAASNAVVDEGNNIFLVDGTTQRLPNVLPADDVEKLSALQSAPLGTMYKIESPVSPDDRTVLGSFRGQYFFIDLRDGGSIPLKQEKPPAAASNFLWLDNDTLGYLSTNSAPSKESNYIGITMDRRTGDVKTGEPRLANVLPYLTGKLIPVQISPDRQRMLIIDATEAKPLKLGAAPADDAIKASRPDSQRAFAGDVERLGHGYDPIPTLLNLFLTEGAKLKAVDVVSGTMHEIHTMQRGTTLKDASFSPDGDKISLTIVSTSDAQDRLFDGVRMPEFSYRDSMGLLPPAENPFLQGNDVKVLDFPSGEVKSLREVAGDDVIYNGTNWSADSQTMLVEINTPGRAEGREHPQFNADFHAGGSLRFYNAELSEVKRLERPEIDAPSKEARFVSNDEVIIQTRYGTDGHPYYYNLRTGEFRNMADRPGAYYEVVTTNKSKEIVFVFSSYTDPPDYFKMNWDGKGLKRLTWFTSSVRLINKTAQHPVSFTLSSGEVFSGVLVLPADVPFPPKNVPIVVWQAGGPQAAVTNSWHNSVEVPHGLLPNFGIGVLTVPLYGRWGLGAERADALADGNNFGQIDIDAQAEIVDQMRERGWVSKVGIVGCSYGGYFVTQSVTSHQTTYDAAHSMCSIVDMVTEWSRGDGRLLPFLEGKTIYEAFDEYKRDSPIYQAANVKTPLLAFHGTKDFLPFAVMENFMSQVIATGTPAKLMKFKDAVHGFTNTQPATLSDAYEFYGAQEQLQWFRKYLVE